MAQNLRKPGLLSVFSYFIAISTIIRWLHAEYLQISLEGDRYPIRLCR